MNKKSILILGASSDIGNEVIKIFLKNDWKVYAHYNKNSKIFKSRDILFRNNLRLIKADFSKIEQFNKFSTARIGSKIIELTTGYGEKLKKILNIRTRNYYY